MFGNNTIMKKDHGDGQTLRVVKGSPFLTVQGEGPYAGRAAVFIRLHGCHLRCVFCDTDFDAADNPVIHLYDLQRAITEVRGRANIAVITGGEPMRQNIMPLCERLAGMGMVTQIETAGTFWIDGIEDCCEIVCSPKTPTIHPMVEQYAVAFKYVIDADQQYGGGEYGYVPITATQPGARSQQLALPRPTAPVYLSPMDTCDLSRNKLNQVLVGNFAKQYGVIAGLQLHKFMELP